MITAAPVKILFVIFIAPPDCAEPNLGLIPAFTVQGGCQIGTLQRDN
jgi:hypothetical protein